jgi:hypothetical protein
VPVFINEVIAEALQSDSTEQTDNPLFAASEEQEERLLRQLQIAQERQARLLVD